MKRLISLAGIFIIFGIIGCGVPGAQADIVINGYLDDWGVAPGAFGASDWTPFGGIQYVVEDQNTYYLNPGYGGQKFDAEAIYYQRTNGNVYVAIVTGHPNTGYNGQYPGDIYFNFGSGMAFGLETTGANAGKLYKNPSWNKSGYWGGVGDPTTMKNGTGAYMGMTTFAYAHTYYGSGNSNDHWVMEMAIPEGYFGSDWAETGTIHWTETCGNDAIDLNVHTPEPATMSLLGLGLFGLLGFRRRRKS